MPHTCEDCEETFETLSRLRLHDCPGDVEWDMQAVLDRDEGTTASTGSTTTDGESAARRRASEELTGALERARHGDRGAVYQALAHYERHLSAEWEHYEEGNYWGFFTVFFRPAIEGLERAVVESGWPYLLDVLEAYWPEATFDLETYPDHEPFGGAEESDREAYPHVSHVLTTVTGRHMVRTRREDSVAAIPATALEYQLPFHRHPGSDSPWLDSMSYGWGIGHPDHPVGETLETLVDGEYEVWAATAIEHALHADQHAAASLLEGLFDDGKPSDPALFFRILGTIDRGEYPDSGEHWDWETLYAEHEESGFDWDPDVRDRLRRLVEQTEFDQRLSEEWTFADIVV